MSVVRGIVAAFGLVLVLVTLASVLRTLIIPRGAYSKFGRLVDRAVDMGFLLVTKRVGSYEERDEILAAQAAVYLVALLAAWLGAFLIGFAFLLWPSTHDLAGAFR